MEKHVDEIKQTLVRVSEDISSFDLLLELDRFLSNMNIYAYKHWDLGELVEGPKVSRHWIDTTWMYPHVNMPDPMGGMRLEKQGCKVTYKKAVLAEPVEYDPDDGDVRFRDVKTKQSQMKKYNVWLVTIACPLSIVDDSLSDQLTVNNEEYVNTDDLDSGYEASEMGSSDGMGDGDMGGGDEGDSLVDDLMGE